MKRIVVLLAVWFTLVATFGSAICDAKGGGGSSSGGRSSSSSSFSSSKSSSSISTSKPATSTGSGFSTSKPTGSGYNTTKTNEANKAATVSTPAATSSSSYSSTNSNSYSGSNGGGINSFWTGMMLGNLMHPTHVSTPVVTNGGYGGSVGVSTPFSFIYIIIDIILLCLVFGFIYFIYKRYNRNIGGK